MAALLLAGAAAATPPSQAELDARFNHLAQELRCLVCRNQSLAESPSELAQDLKERVRSLLAQGWSEQAVREHLVERYGEVVLYRPRLEPATWALWFGPALLPVIGLALLAARWRRRGAVDEDTAETA